MKSTVSFWIHLILFSVLGLWPLIHLALAINYEVNPWRFFGWGMYAVPHPRVSVIVERGVSASTLVAIETFAEHRAEYGSLWSTRDLDSLMKEQMDPNMSEIRFQIVRKSLNDRGCVSSAIEQYVVTRSGTTVSTR